eukprot:3671815-Prorocentrum_lima.AAC.1
MSRDVLSTPIAELYSTHRDCGRPFVVLFLICTQLTGKFVDRLSISIGDVCSTGGDVGCLVVDFYS